MNIWPFSTIRKLRAEIARLQAELEQARRNDYRDKSGRFARRPSNG